LGCPWRWRIGGAPEQFAPLIKLYRDVGRRAGHDASQLRVSINSHGFLADDSNDAANTFFPSYAEAMTRIGRERGWPPTTRRQFDASRSPRGALLVGDPQEVIDKILREHELFAQDRFLAQFTVGSIPHDKVMRSIELLGTKVAPAIRSTIGRTED
jgi:alkanesulfonate monooxygenase SsuD/methylene tetrahydromethanopterin reductase-like flavin-dependent oxidoreductase (luciferase family)